MGKNKIDFLFSMDGLDFYKYKVGLLRYFYLPMAPYEKLLSRQIRETFDYIRGGYLTLYVKRYDQFIGKVSITKGGLRNKFCNKKDLVIVNLWIQPEYRGFGYSKTVVKGLLSTLMNHYDIYAYIRHDNYSSIKSLKANGFKYIENASYRGILKSVVINSKGEFGIYKLSKEREQDEFDL